MLLSSELCSPRLATPASDLRPSPRLSSPRHVFPSSGLRAKAARARATCAGLQGMVGTERRKAEQGKAAGAEPDFWAASKHVHQIGSMEAASIYDQLCDQSNDTHVLMVVYAPWCSHCKTMETEVERLARELSHEKAFKIVALDGSNPASTYFTSSVLGLNRLPSLVLFPKNSKTLYKFKGSNINSSSLHKFVNMVCGQHDGANWKGASRAVGGHPTVGHIHGHSPLHTHAAHVGLMSPILSNLLSMGMVVVALAAAAYQMLMKRQAGETGDMAKSGLTDARLYGTTATAFSGDMSGSGGTSVVHGLVPLPRADLAVRPNSALASEIDASLERMSSLMAQMMQARVDLAYGRDASMPESLPTKRLDLDPSAPSNQQQQQQQQQWYSRQPSNSWLPQQQQQDVDTSASGNEQQQPWHQIQPTSSWQQQQQQQDEQTIEVSAQAIPDPIQALATHSTEPMYSELQEMSSENVTASATWDIVGAGSSSHGGPFHESTSSGRAEGSMLGVQSSPPLSTSMGARMAAAFQMAAVSDVGSGVEVVSGSSAAGAAVKTEPYSNDATDATAALQESEDAANAGEHMNGAGIDVTLTTPQHAAAAAADDDDDDDAAFTNSYDGQLNGDRCEATAAEIAGEGSILNAVEPAERGALLLPQDTQATPVPTPQYASASGAQNLARSGSFEVHDATSGGGGSGSSSSRPTRLVADYATPVEGATLLIDYALDCPLPGQELESHLTDETVSMRKMGIDEVLALLDEGDVTDVLERFLKQEEGLARRLRS